MASNRLNYSVWLSDKTQKGFNSVKKSFSGMQSMAQKSQASWQTVGTGGAGLWGVAASVNAMTAPAREMNSARGELASLLGDNAGSTLDLVQNQAMAFSEDYGKSASEFVSASYDIQSAIDGLSPDNLASFTTASAVLATATKADTATITNYMGTMYGIFKRNVNAMGKSQWIEQLAGQTATAVQMFKTTGDAMNEAFAGLGSRAANQNISAGEQFAVLGTLQSTMRGGTAGTAYAGFLDALPNAEKTLNLSLSGANGKALGMIDIIDKLKAKLGDDLGVQQLGWLNKAFGTNAAGMIQNLWTQTDTLKSSIESLNNVSGMDKAITMAKAIADPYEQLAQAGNNIRVVFGQAFSQSIQPMIAYMIGGAQTLRTWITLFPNITKLVGYLTLGILALTAGMATMAIITGTTTLAWTGLTAIWFVAKFLTGGLWSGIAMLAKGLWKLVPAVWSVGSAFVATFGWIPIAIIAVIAAVVALWYCWDQLTALIANADWFKAVSSAFDSFIDKLKTVRQWASSIWTDMSSWFGDDSKITIDQQVEALNQHAPVSRATSVANSGPLPQQFTQSISNKNSTQTQHIGQVNFNTSNAPTPQLLNEYIGMSAP